MLNQYEYYILNNNNLLVNRVENNQPIIKIQPVPGLIYTLNGSTD